jgi:hypothetical protein
MSRPGTAWQGLEGADSVPRSGADTVIRAAAGVTVAGLAGIAGAISYSHMRVLATAHGETGWQGHAFPLSVDGIEIVASLVLLADRRTGQRSGWLPWAALAAGTTASPAANVAAASAGLVGRVVAGWPALALLTAVKLLSEMLGRRHGADRPGTADNHRILPEDRPRLRDGGDGPALGAAQDAGHGGVAAAAARNRRDDDAGTGVRDGTASGRGDDDRETVTMAERGTGTAARWGTGTAADVAALLPVARAARDHLSEMGAVLTCDSLAAQLRRDGHAMRNARVSQLLTALKHEAIDTDNADAAVGLSRAGRRSADPGVALQPGR